MDTPRLLGPALTLGLAVSALAPSVAQAGWVATQSSKSIGVGTPIPQISKLAYEKNFFRIDNPDDTSVILDLASGKVSLLNHKKKLFAAMTLDDIKKQRDDYLAKARAQLPSMDAQTRATVEAHLAEIEGRTKKDEMKLNPTGAKDKVAGYECTVFRWTSRQGDGEACIAAKPPLDVVAFTKDMLRLADRLEAIGGGGGVGSFSTLGKQGFPMRTRQTMMNGSTVLDVVTEITELKEQKVDGTRFHVPGDYKASDAQTVMTAR
ncbi:DUF4412 domain-containing protein [Myxococcota bacterium]|nr:DUF4412 domain-containing protein [Myxococcota bacterium]